MLLLFLFSLSSSISFGVVSAFKLSSKVAKITMSGSKHMLAISENSDSISSFPPRLSVYTIGSSRIIHSHKYSGESSSLGRKITPIGFGFLASSPQQAYYWGKPGPLLTKIFPPRSETIPIDTPMIPYGDTLGSSDFARIVVACSPFSADSCLFIENTNTTRKIEKPTGLSYFGLSVTVSPNGQNFAILSSDDNGHAVLKIYNSKDFTVEQTFTIPHTAPLTPKEREPFLKFKDDRQITLAFIDIGKIFQYKSTVNGWISVRPSEVSCTAIYHFGRNNNNFVTLTKDGLVNLKDENFNEMGEYVVQRSIQNSEFTDIVAGDDWFAVLEESEFGRTLHIVSTAKPWYIRFIVLFCFFVCCTLAIIIIRPKMKKTKPLPISRSRSRNLFKTV